MADDRPLWQQIEEAQRVLESAEQRLAELREQEVLEEASARALEVGMVGRYFEFIVDGEPASVVAVYAATDNGFRYLTADARSFQLVGNHHGTYRRTYDMVRHLREISREDFMRRFNAVVEYAVRLTEAPDLPPPMETPDAD